MNSKKLKRMRDSIKQKTQKGNNVKTIHFSSTAKKPPCPLRIRHKYKRVITKTIKLIQKKKKIQNFTSVSKQ